MRLIDDAERQIIKSLNAEGRSPGHVAAGLAICGALIAATAVLSSVRKLPPAPGAEPSGHPVMRTIWPSLFSVTTLAALRIWNAPSSPRRTRALGLWALVQTASLGFTLWRPRDRTAQIVAAVATAGLTAVYARAAAHVDEKAANIAAPTGFTGLANIAATPS